MNKDIVRTCIDYKTEKDLYFFYRWWCQKCGKDNPVWILIGHKIPQLECRYCGHKDKGE